MLGISMKYELSRMWIEAAVDYVKTDPIISVVMWRAGGRD
jgi:hypothetical protein